MPITLLPMAGTQRAVTVCNTSGNGGSAVMRMHAIQRGFTLIELMIVVAIIAILAAIAIPAYQNYLIRAQVTEGMNVAAAAETGVWDFLASTGRYPTNNRSAGLAATTSIVGTYVTNVDVTGGKITVTYGGSKANVAITTAGQNTLVLSPSTTAGDIIWTCTPSTVDDKYLPATCRH